MPDSRTAPAVRPPARARSAPPAAGGWVEAHPRHRARLAALGLTTASAILELPGEVVSGHPDRHVVRVELPGWPGALYLKRQHRVGWRERLRQRLAGFGWASRCEREARLLSDLDAAGFPCPQWVAHGQDGRGRTFLLVEELADAADLRRFLGDTRLSPDDRARLAERLGQAVAELHAAGFDTPDLTAKHVFVRPDTFAVTLIDWQSARRVARLDLTRRVRALAAFHASLADRLASTRDRLRFLWAYLLVCRRNGLAGPQFADVARRIHHESRRALQRRSIRDQRQPVVTATEQRLVWVAGEAVCAVPELAGAWPTPAVAAPFYGEPPGTVPVELPDGRLSELVRGTTFAPLSRLVARVRGRAWRSPGVTFGRVLFHLQRYGLPGPQLLAFGQRESGPTTAEWFALYEPPAGVPLAEWLSRPAPLSLRREVLGQVGFLLRQLHDAGCRSTGPGSPFRVDADGRVSVGEARSVRIARRVAARARRADLLALLRQLPTTRTDRLRVVRGYLGNRRPDDRHHRTTARLAVGCGNR